MSKIDWLRVAKLVLDGQFDNLRCPESDDDILDVQWIVGPTSGSGEYWLRCRGCGAQNFILIG